MSDDQHQRDQMASAQRDHETEGEPLRDMSDRQWFRTTIDLIDAFGDRMADGHNRQADLLRGDLIRHLLTARSELRRSVFTLDCLKGETDG